MKNIFLSNISFNRLRALSDPAIVGHLQNYKQGPISFCVSLVTSPHMCVTHTHRKTRLTQQECEITMFRDQQWRGSSWAMSSQKTWDTSGKAMTPPPPPNSWSLSGTLPNSFETQSAAHARCVKWKLQAGWEELHYSQWCCTQRVLLWVIDDNIYQLIIINEMAGIVNIHSGSIGYSFRCIHSWCRPIHPLNRMNIINTEHEALKSVFYLLIKSAKALRIWVLSLSTILWSFFGSIELHFTFVVPVI